ncbi:hypothetical protein FBU59_001108 [Linderina macrospora]|uniref:Uncharacterized protein n=1 Tax=Linderina macrospora TaxID=4868 RepID=A0ACC1JF54_9FUNG|nr:hypothetical protein FBU59_001108 [Linderina macrospora]
MAGKMHALFNRPSSPAFDSMGAQEKAHGSETSSVNYPTAEEGGYVPPPRTAGFLKTLANVVCIIIGTGALQIPYVFSKIGYVGLVIIAMSAFIGMYSGSITIKCLYYKEGRRLRTFTDIGYHSYGLVGQYFTQFFNYLFCIGTTALFVILSGGFLYDLISDDLNVNISKRVWMVIVSCVITLPLLVLKHMSEIAIMSIFGFLASLVMIMVAVIQSFRFPYSPKAGGPPVATHKAGIASGIPTALSSIVFSFSGTIIYPHVEACMAKPKMWPRVISVAMLICFMLYSLIGIAGYWAYGDQAESPILNSIRKDGAQKAAKVLVTVHVILAAPLLIMPFFLEVEERWNINVQRFGRVKELLIRDAYRTVTMVAICGISVGIPYFDSVLSLLGALSVTMMFTFVPVVAYYRLYGGYKKIPWYELIWMFIVVVIGLIGCVWGSIDAIESLVKQINDGK